MTDTAHADRWVLTLYVDGGSANSSHAIETVRRICDEELSGHVDLEIVDVNQQPALVVRDHIVAAPTLVKRLPGPPRRIVGDLSDSARLRFGLGLGPGAHRYLPGSKNAQVEGDAAHPTRAGKPMAASSAPKATGPSGRALGPPGESGAETAELAEVRARLREATETIEAIRGGGVDSLLIGPPGQEKVYALASADRPYRLIVEAMNEGAATVSPRGVILDVNPRLASMTGRTATDLVGTAVLDLVSEASRPTFARMLDVGADPARGEIELSGPGGATVPVLLAVGAFELDGTLLRCLVLTDLTTQRAAEVQAAEGAHGVARAKRLPRAGSSVAWARLVDR